jgi:hypothetical protein
MSSLKILIAAIAAATFSLAFAQGTPPKPAPNAATGEGQRSTMNTPMGTTGTPTGGGAMAQGTSGASGAAATTAGSSSGAMASDTGSGARSMGRGTHHRHATHKRHHKHRHVRKAARN